MAGLVPLVLGGRVSAAPFESVPNYASKADFKRDCQSFKKSTWDEGKYSTACTYNNGDIKVCDENGKNCTWHPAAQAPAPGPFGGPLDVPLGSLDAVTVAGPPAANTAAPRAKGKKGSKRRKR